MTLIRPRNYRPPSERKGAAPAPAETQHPEPLSASQDEAQREPRTTLPRTDDLQQRLAGALRGRMEVLEPIALGGMAVLFRLRHSRTGGQFVAKIMRPELGAESSLRAAFAEEARVGALLGAHPNAVPVLDLDDAGGLPFLLMPYIAGEDLDHLLSRTGALGRDRALMLLAQMSSLLLFLETQALVHADIALGNLRLDSFSQYRLLDYGLARRSGQPAPELARQAGTPASNSPEQLRGMPLDVRSDLYSLGLVFLHALTGHSPFGTEDLDELARAHLSGSWRQPPELESDPALRELISSLLATDREQRLPSAFALAGALSALGYELPSFAHSLHPGEAAPAPRIRRRRLEASA